MHLAACRVFYFLAVCASRSIFGFYCGVLFNSPPDISQSMGKWKYEFAQDVVTDVPSTELLKALLHKFPVHKAADVIA